MILQKAAGLRNSGKRARLTPLARSSLTKAVTGS